MDTSLRSSGGISRHILSDPTMLSLLFSNLLTIYLAVSQDWSLITIMWVYWFQSVTIGFFNFIRILTLKDFSTDGFKVNNRSVEATKKTKISTAIFFAFHYGFFHFVYAIFLVSFSFSGLLESSGQSANGFGDAAYVLLTSAVFFVNHLHSFLYNRGRDAGKQNIGRVMFFPYARIIPMHLTIIFGMLLGKGAIVLFLTLKTLADMIMHVLEHN